MTPGARVQAAIEVLDGILAGEAAERILTAWARGNRYAGSKDRAAVRDHVFDALRMLRSAGWAGGVADHPGAGDARAVMAGVLSQAGADVEALFSGQGHAPAPLDGLEAVSAEMPAPVRLDVPDWLLPILQDDLGDEAETALNALRQRGPVYLRANAARISAADLVKQLSQEGIEAVQDDTAPTAVRLTDAARGLTNLPSFIDGLWELQDAGSQALIARLPDTTGARILDLCAGGGGKALALSARGAGQVFAYDADAARMRDIPIRAERAGVVIKRLSNPEIEGPFDGVIADVPCSGSGSWRRAPDAKWRLTPERLDELSVLQTEILGRAASLVRPGGWIAYMTCSILERENGAVVDRAMAMTPGLHVQTTWSCLPRVNGPDGFFLNVLRRED